MATAKKKTTTKKAATKKTSVKKKATPKKAAKKVKQEEVVLEDEELELDEEELNDLNLDEDDEEGDVEDDIDLDDIEDEDVEVAEEEKPKKKTATKKASTEKTSAKKKATTKPVVEEGVKEQVELKVASLLKNSLSLREQEDIDIDEMVESIKKQGLLYPVLVDSEGRLIDGKRRVLAFKALGNKTIPATKLNESTEGGRFLKALCANESRTDMHPLEKGAAYKKALDDGYVKTQKELASLVGCTPARINQLVGLMNEDDLDEETREALIESDVTSQGTLDAIKKLPKDKKKDAVKKVKEGKASVSSGKFKQAVNKEELPEGVKVTVFADSIQVVFNVADDTKTMRNFDLKKEITGTCEEFSDELNDLIRVARKEVLS